MKQQSSTQKKTTQEQYYQVQEILDTRKKPGHSAEYLIKWKNYPIGQSTWQPIGNLKNAIDLVMKFEEKQRLRAEQLQKKKMKIKQHQNTLTEPISNPLKKVKSITKSDTSNPINVPTQTNKSSIKPVVKKQKEVQIIQKKQTSDSKDNDLIEIPQKVLVKKNQNNQANPRVQSNIPKKGDILRIIYKSKSEKGEHIYMIEFNSKQRVYLSSSQIKKKYSGQFILFLQENLLKRLSSGIESF